MALFEDYIPPTTLRVVSVPSGSTIRVSHTGHLHAAWLLDTQVRVPFYEGFNQSVPVKVTHDSLQFQTFGHPVYLSVQEGAAATGGQVLISAPDGAYAGAPLIASGGAPIVYSSGEYVPIVASNGMVITPYMFLINGVQTGQWFTSPTTLPNTLSAGQSIQVKDALGNTSNILMAIAVPVVLPARISGGVLSGSTAPSSTLTVTDVVWSNSPTSTTREWYKNNTATGVTTLTYSAATVAGDVLQPRFTATNAAGTASYAPTAITVVALPARTSGGVTTGSTAPSSVLTVTDVVWSGSPTSTTREWFKNGSGTGVTTLTYSATTVAGDVLEPRFTATNVSGTTSYSGNSITVVALPLRSSGGVVTGTTDPASTLTSTDVVWTGATSTTREWYKNGSGTGVTTLTYSAARVAGDVMLMHFTATNSSGTTVFDSNSITAVSSETFQSRAMTMGPQAFYRLGAENTSPAGLIDVTGNHNGTWNRGASAVTHNATGFFSDGVTASQWTALASADTLCTTEIANGLFADVGRPWTVSIHYQIPLLTAAASLISRAGSSASNRTFSLNMSALSTRKGLSLRLRGTSYDFIAGGDDQKHMATIVWDGTNTTVYIDGIYTQTFTKGTAVEETTQRIIIGARENGAAGVTVGVLGNAIFLNRALSELEVRRLRFNPSDDFNKKVVILGSSTAAGVSNPASGVEASWGRMFARGYSGLTNNLGLGGTTISMAIPTGGTVPSGFSPIDTTRNVNAAKSLGANTVIICFAGNESLLANGVAGYQSCAQQIVTYCDANGMDYRFMTTIPRVGNPTVELERLRDIAAWLKATYTTKCADIYTELVNPVTLETKPEYNYDGIHGNEAAHLYFLQQVLLTNP